MQELQDDYYEILGVEDQASPDDIRKAYLKLAKKLHPDRYPNDPEKRQQAQLEFSKVTRAHETLSDPRQKEEYDAIRALARNRAALDAGIGGGAVASSAPAGGAAGAQTGTMDGSKVESKESWAAKHSQRAKDCYSKKRFQEAETAIKEAIRLVPNKVEYHTQLAQIYMARGWKTLAQTEIQTALRIDPKDPDAKSLEIKLKAAATAKKDEKKGGGLLDQIKQLLNKKV